MLWQFLVNGQNNKIYKTTFRYTNNLKHTARHFFCIYIKIFICVLDKPEGPSYKKRRSTSSFVRRRTLYVQSQSCNIYIYYIGICVVVMFFFLVWLECSYRFFFSSTTSTLALSSYIYTTAYSPSVSVVNPHITVCDDICGKG